MALISGIANTPVLPAGWKPVNHVSGQTFQETTLANWKYNYDPNNTVNGVAPKMWANAKDTKGNLWVWIPRFTYRAIQYADDPEVKIRFSNGTTDDTTSIDGRACKKHPAFKFGTVELSGIWVMKYEAYQDTANGGIPGSLPGQVSWRSITVNDIFNQCLNLKNHVATSDVGLDSHMLKNSEWGAVALLAYAVGHGRPKINGDSGYHTGYTTNGATNATGSLDTSGETSTTGNPTGVFDMVGCGWHYVASYVNNGNSNLTTYCQSLVNADAKYKDVFPVGSGDTRAANYSAASGLTDGMLIHETSTAGEGSTSWKNWNNQAADSNFPWSSFPVFFRGGNYGSGGAGLAYFGSYDGSAYGYGGFRACFVNLNSAPLISGSDEDLGEKSGPFSIVYQVSDPDGDSVNITEKINGNVVRTIEDVAQETDIELAIDLTTWGNLALNQSHTITIEATDSFGNTSTRTYTFTKVNAVPSAPGSIISPVAGSTVVGNVTIEWTEATDPDGDELTYSVYYSADEGATLLPIATGVTALMLAWDTSTVEEGTNYRIYVRANDGKVDGPFAVSGIFSIVHNLSPDALLAIAPVHTARVPLQPVFMAGVGTDPEGDPQHFRLQIAKDVNFTNIVADLETSTQNLLTANQAGVEADTTGFTARGATIERSTAQFYEGAASLQVTTSGTIANEGVELSPVDVLGGKSYAAQVKVKGAGYIRLVIEELDSEGNYLRSTGSNPITLDGTSWQTLSVFARTGQDCAKLRLAVLTSSVIGATFYCDAFMLVKGEFSPDEFIPGQQYGPGTADAIAGWEIYDGANWVPMPATGAPVETERVRHSLRQPLQQNQSYYWRMAARDTTGSYGEWTLPRIIRAGNVLQFRLKTPIETSAEVERVLVFGYHTVAKDGANPAVFKVEASNNAFDPFPVWEDITAAYLARKYAELSNKNRTADKWGLDVRVTIWANDTLGTIEVLGLGIAFD